MQGEERELEYEKANVEDKITLVDDLDKQVVPTSKIQELKRELTNIHDRLGQYHSKLMRERTQRRNELDEARELLERTKVKKHPDAESKIAELEERIKNHVEHTEEHRATLEEILR